MRALTISSADYIKAVKRINRQLQRIAKASREGGEDYTDYAYRLAMYDIKSIFGYAHGGRERRTFSTVIPTTKTGKPDQRRMAKVMRAIERFYEHPTATLTGIKDIYSKRAKTLSAKFGLEEGEELTANQLKKLFDSGLWRDLKKEGYGSKTIVKIIGDITKQKNELKEQLKKGDSIIEIDSRYSKRILKVFNKDPDAIAEYLGAL